MMGNAAGNAVRNRPGNKTGEREAVLGNACKTPGQRLAAFPKWRGTPVEQTATDTGERFRNHYTVAETFRSRPQSEGIGTTEHQACALCGEERYMKRAAA